MSQTNNMGRIHKIKVPKELKIHNKNLSFKQTSAATAQTSATTKLLPPATTQKPATIKLLPPANIQTPAATKQMHNAAAELTPTLASPTHKPPANQAPMSQSTA
ncbi:hypothetical protein DSO57_1007768 [Entomophthora muscae]|uniref:Uncharacterized protein n=1 Tax=Entomophthora muscae TaxID=34485 RepID=A0ACC2US74_9FUNG|nr:hypothetical protein DSO57_1007768 [Entomophthora muscae]